MVEATAACKLLYSLPTLARVSCSRDRKEGAAASTHRSSSPEKIEGQQLFDFFYMDTTRSGNSPSQESRFRYFCESTAGVECWPRGINLDSYSLYVDSTPSKALSWFKGDKAFSL